MERKILIITLYGNNNFGNKLQNYALQQSIKKLDDSFEVYSVKVKYRNANPLKYIYRFFLDFFNRFKKVNAREKVFIEFSNNYINYYPKCYSTNLLFDIHGFDYYVYGSDQVWNPYITGWSNLFLGFKTHNNISYAASFGVDHIPNKYINNYKKLVNSFKNISLREEEGKRIVDSLTGNTNSCVVVDPTMLLSRDEWQRIEKKPKCHDGKKYILVYFLGKQSDKRKKEINKIALDNNYNIINILDPQSNYYNCGPQEFLWLERNAELICTDSFHSSVFAFIFDRPFVVFDREDNNKNMGSRIDTLLSTFEIDNRRYNGKYITKDNLNHNYSNSFKILEKNRKKGIKFLVEALDINK